MTRIAKRSDRELSDNVKFQMTNSKTKTIYDLAERTTLFAEGVVLFVGTLKENIVNKNLIHQVVKSSTSIGANYMEADVAQSKRDFEHKLGICRKEAKETAYWMRIIVTANPESRNECLKFSQEATELVKIFSTIISNSKSNPLV